MSRKRTGLKVSAVSIGAFLMALIAVPYVSEAVSLYPTPASPLSVTAGDGSITYKFDGTYVSSYDKNGNSLGSTNVCPTATSCNTYFGNGTIFQELLIDQDSDGLYLVGIQAIRPPKRSMQPNYATRVVKFDVSSQIQWDNSYFVQSSNYPLSSNVDANNVLNIDVKACTNKRMGGAGQICPYDKNPYTIQIDNAGKVVSGPVSLVL